MIPVLIAQAAADSAVDKLVSAITNGLSLGAIYALLALGFVIIFKATQVISFAHGAIAALGAYLVAYFATVINFPGDLIGGPTWLQWTVSAIFAVLMTAVVGLVIERLAIRPMIGEPMFSIAMVTIGLDIALRIISNDFISTEARPLGDPFGTSVWEAGPVSMAHSEIAAITVTIILVVAIAWFFRTRIGIAMRATAFDQEAAMAQGISVGRIFAIAWAIGAGLAAVAGIFASLFPRASQGVSSETAFFVFRAFPAIILGGLDSVPGAVVGGFIIGLAESFAGKYLTWSGFGVGFSGIVPYLVMMVVLLVRPYGLFGTEEIRRV
ncbi:MAG: branched-chain amino acid ABC transporter permease [Acidimicrobiia bacterium]|nr:branched-chain amino acid ABC transporter permease [Acidimicrobiia bacterium]